MIDCTHPTSESCDFTLTDGGSLIVRSRFSGFSGQWTSCFMVNGGAEPEDMVLMKRHATRKGAENWAARIIKLHTEA